LNITSFEDPLKVARVAGSVVREPPA
jgi:hypothetical protein